MKFLYSFLAIICFAFSLHAQKNVEKAIQTQFIMVEDGGTVELEAGTFEMSGSLAMDSKNDIIIKGKGMDKTILTWKGQKTGAEGIKITNGTNITIQDVTLQDSKGDCIKVQETDGISFVNVKVEWTGKPSKKNGAYGFYPVQCKNVLIDKCEAIGASDAGIYVGQSDQIVVRNSRAYQNVAGIEIENSTNADVHNNIAEDNTGGILVFDLPDLMKKNGGNVRVFNNKITGNNLKNFSPPGNMVAIVPPGTGILVLATSDVEIFDNEITNNRTLGTGIASYLYTQIPLKDEEYDAYPKRVYVHDNVYQKDSKRPKLNSDIGKWLFLKFKKDVPDILYDGIPEDGAMGENEQFKLGYEICVKNNGEAVFLNLNAKKGLKYHSKDAGAFDCSLEALEGAKESLVKGKK
ncbi:MAG: parallel beta-helix domain-containing protein [Bacteroidota bacterium]